MIDPKALRNALGSFPTGVTVVTTVSPDGTPVGFTANSFTSVSLDPPMLLVCPGKFLSSFPVFEGCQHFAVSVLAEGQETVSNTFASRTGDRFAQTNTTDDIHGVPLISGAAARFSCEKAKVVDAGDHIILIGKIVDFSQTGARGLGYASGQYFSLGLERAASAVGRDGGRVNAGLIVESDGALLLENTSSGWRPPQVTVENRDGVRHALESHFTTNGVATKLGAAYSIFDDRKGNVHYTYFLATVPGRPKTPLGDWVPIGEIQDVKFHTDAHGVMLNRYALEYATRDFRLYIGDEASGDHHQVT